MNNIDKDSVDLPAFSPTFRRIAKRLGFSKWPDFSEFLLHCEYDVQLDDSTAADLQWEITMYKKIKAHLDQPSIFS